MFKVKAALVLLLMVALILRIVLWAIEPAIPLALIGLVIVIAYSLIFRRQW